MAYAEAINDDVYLPVPSNLDQFKSENVQDIIRVLEKRYPDISFNYGLSDHDLSNNARSTQILSILDKVNNRLREIDTAIRPMDKLLISIDDETTPVKLGPYLRSFLKYLKPMAPSFRMGGSNGELTVLKLTTEITSLKKLTKVWLRNVKSKIEIFDAFPDIQILYPTTKQNISIISNHEKNLLSAMSVASNLKGLSQILLQHYNRGLFDVVEYTKDRFPSGFKKALENLTVECFLCYKEFLSLYEYSSDIYLPEIDSRYICAWNLMYDMLGLILNILNFGIYDSSKLLAEISSKPHCLSEIMSYSSKIPNGSFEDTIAYLNQLDLL